MTPGVRRGGKRIRRCRAGPLGIAVAFLLLTWAFSALVLIDPDLLGSGKAGAPDPGVRAAPPRAAPGSVPARETRHAPKRFPGSHYTLPPASAPLPVHVEFKHPPKAGLLFDLGSGETLWQHDPGRRLPIASLTKMMTALIIARRERPGERVLITPQAVHTPGSGVGVLPLGKEVPLRDLFYGLLLVSGNDAATALAQHDGGSVGGFVARMNRWRRQLGLRCSHFTSPSGIVDEGNYSCTRDLASLARADLANPWIRKVAGTREIRFRFPVKGHFLDLYNNNPFIFERMPGITGLKTGYTLAAGRCYVTTQRVGGHELGVVLLNAPNPLDQVPALLRAGAKAVR